MLDAPAFTETDFVDFAIPAAAVASAVGIVRLLGGNGARGAMVAAVGGTVYAAVLVPVVYVTGWQPGGVDGTGPPTRGFYELWIAIAALVVGALALAAARDRRRRPLLVPLLLAAAIVPGLLNVPLDVFPRAIFNWRAGHPQYATERPNLTEGLYLGYDWLRTHTPTDAVIADDAYSRTPTPGADLVNADNYAPAAYAERRVFLGGWLYAPASYTHWDDVVHGKVVPYPRRLAVNEAVFVHGDRRALKELTSQYGVRYLVVDLVHRAAVPGPALLGRRVYANPQLQIYAVG
jgi:hypothetical protein